MPEDETSNPPSSRLSELETRLGRSEMPLDSDKFNLIGCEFSSSCFTCPLPKCKYDYPFPVVRIRQWISDQKLLKTVQGLGAVDAATRLGVTVHTVYRIRKRYLDWNQIITEGTDPSPIREH